MIPDDIELDLDTRIRIRDEVISKLIENMSESDKEDILWDYLLNEHEYYPDWDLVDEYLLYVDKDWDKTIEFNELIKETTEEGK